MNARSFVLSTLVGTVALVAITWCLAWWLEPISGDLTRIGSYAERHFGHQAPQLEFHPPLSTFGDWKEEIDILVMGDSFANGTVRQWQNWLAAATGWRIHTLDKKRISVDKVLSSTLYREHPPRVVIWNVVERDLLYEFSATGRCGPYSPVVVSAVLPRRATPATPVEVSRPNGLSELNPGFARMWVWNSLLRAVGIDSSGTLEAKLTRNDLFSSRHPESLLVYRDDLLKRKWSSSDLQKIRCGLSSLASRFESNGRTRFVTALAPDKSSAYHAWLVSPSSLPPSILPALLHESPIPDAGLHASLADEVSRGVKDVYLPNDTHWGTAGHKATAERILQLLINEGLTE